LTAEPLAKLGTSPIIEQILPLQESLFIYGCMMNAVEVQIGRTDSSMLPQIRYQITLVRGENIADLFLSFQRRARLPGPGPA
jgi:hypothetical protein